MYHIVIKIKQHEHMYGALLGDHAYSFLWSNSGSEGSFFFICPRADSSFFSEKMDDSQNMCYRSQSL
jgi:hypothetical protein